MNKVTNYLGQLRVYSLIDLALLLVAFHLPVQSFVGAITLWLGFVSLLEYQHRHPYRLRFPFLLPLSLVLVGLWYFGSTGLVFLAWSILYCKKNKNGWGLVSPVFRGLQTISLVWSRASWPMIGCVLLLITLRNLLGDARDTSKDRRTGMTTWPVLLNWSDHKYAHLLAVMGTSTIWWHLTNFNPAALVGVWLLQLATYWLTPR